MAALPPGPRRRPRRGSAERPVNSRTYRGTWLLVGIPLLIAAFSVSTPPSLPRAALPPAFDADHARTLAEELAGLYPDRRPGTPGAAKAAHWVETQLRQEGYRPQVQHFEADLPTRGRTQLINVTAVAPGRSPETIVVLAHRDDVGDGPGANDNASGTAALIEIARLYGTAGQPAAGAPAPGPARTLVFVSTDGGAYGWSGARHFLDQQVRPRRILAVVDLDSIAGRARPGVQLAGDRPRSAPAALVATAAQRLAEQSGEGAAHPSPFAQLIDLAFPFNLYEHAVFVGDAIPALTLTTAGSRPPDPTTDTTAQLSTRRLRQIGRSADALVTSLDQAGELARGTASYLYFGSRIVRGWAVELALIAAMFPFLMAAVDLFARCRRRRIPLIGALRSYRRRLGFWLWVGAVFGLFALMGAWDAGGAGPPAPEL